MPQPSDADIRATLCADVDCTSARCRVAQAALDARALCRSAQEAYDREHEYASVMRRERDGALARAERLVAAGGAAVRTLLELVEEFNSGLGDPDDDGQPIAFDPADIAAFEAMAAAWRAAVAGTGGVKP